MISILSFTYDAVELKVCKMCDTGGVTRDRI
jgi:hypothetical protein